MELVGEKVILRFLKEADYLEIYQGMTDKNMPLFNGVPYPYTQIEAKKYIAKTLKYRTRGKGLHFAIIEKKSGKLAGTFGLMFKRKDGPVASIGYWLGAGFRSKGLMSEAVKLVLDLAFEKLGMEKINARVYLPNRRSAHVLERYGFMEEGRQRRQIYRMGLVFDALMFGLLKEEYLAKKSI
jgi:RimJ/RimL family protein N-acetyltransferase